MTVYSKSLRPFLKTYLSKASRRKYPKFESLIEHFLMFMENTNYTGWFSTDSDKKDNSLYHNIEGFRKFMNIDDLPVKNQDVLNAYLTDYAKTLDFRNSFLAFEDEVLRSIAKDSTIIYNCKDSWRAYNYLFALIHSYLINNIEGTLDFEAYYTDDYNFSVETLPDFYYEMTLVDIRTINFGTFLKGGTSEAYGIVKYIDSSTNKVYLDDVEGTFQALENVEDINGSVLTSISSIQTTLYLDSNDILLSEIPAYRVSIGANGYDITQQTITAEDKGAHPFHYQTISKNRIMIAGNFSQKMKAALNPAGFWNENIYIPDDVYVEIYVDTKVFPYQIIETNHITPIIFMDTIANFTSGDTFDITWEYKFGNETVDITYNAGSGDVAIDTVDGTDETYEWDTTGVPAGAISVKIAETNDSDVYDEQTGITVS